MRAHLYVGRILTTRSGDRDLSARLLKVHIAQPGLSSSTEHDPKGNIDTLLRDIQHCALPRLEAISPHNRFAAILCRLGVKQWQS
jgi:hypothetical protein